MVPSHAFIQGQTSMRGVGEAAGPTMWKNTVVWTDAQGREEAFSIGPDGYVWSYYRNAQGASAGRLISTGLLATSFALGRTELDRLVVIAADGTTVRHVMETGDGGAVRWTGPRQATFAGLRDAVSVDKVLAQSIGTSLFVGVLTRHIGAVGQDCFQLWDSVWAGDSLVFCHSPVKLGSESNIWLDALASKFDELV